jgi:hypothetical protein
MASHVPYPSARPHARKGSHPIQYSQTQPGLQSQSPNFSSHTPNSPQYQPQNPSSSTSLLPSSAPTVPGVHALFAQGPTQLRSMRSNSSLVRLGIQVLAFCSFLCFRTNRPTRAREQAAQCPDQLTFPYQTRQVAFIFQCNSLHRARNIPSRLMETDIQTFWDCKTIFYSFKTGIEFLYIVLPFSRSVLLGCRLVPKPCRTG